MEGFIKDPGSQGFIKLKAVKLQGAEGLAIVLRCLFRKRILDTLTLNWPIRTIFKTLKNLFDNKHLIILDPSNPWPLTFQIDTKGLSRIAVEQWLNLDEPNRLFFGVGFPRRLFSARETVKKANNLTPLTRYGSFRWPSRGRP
jgi:hypothetical protein